MINALKASHRLNETLFLGTLTFFCFGAFLFRFLYTDSKVFLFLTWNLFLAFIPWALTSLVIVKPKLQQSPLMLVAVLICWLLFFPNAPYILTDLFHLHSREGIPIWFDLILLLSFAWTGLLFGFLSLCDLEKVLQKYLKKRMIIMLSMSLIFTGSFGIYLGRFLRWNSWDVLTAPLPLLYDIGDRILHPLSHPQTWGMTIFMGLFLNLAYLSFKLIKHRKG